MPYVNDGEMLVPHFTRRECAYRWLKRNTGIFLDYLSQILIWLLALTSVYVYIHRGNVADCIYLMSWAILGKLCERK